MKERIGIIMASAMLVAGCDSLHVTGIEAPSGPPKVDTHAVADVLPGAVAEQLPNTIAIKKMSQISLGYYQNTYTGICSGVKVGTNDYLSAGHCDEDPANKYGYSSPCTDTTVAVASGAELPVDATSDSYIPSIDQNDTMLLHSSGSSPAPETPVHFADSNYITPGTQLYVVNFEPTAGGTLRSPASGNEPVVFGAVALGTRPDGLVEVVDGIKSYSSDGETVVRQGASGGPVFDGNGHLVGLVKGTSTINGQPGGTVQNYETNDHIIITDLPSDAPIDVMVLQPVSANTVTSLQQNLHPNTAPAC